jgi:hypothetical protein
LSYLFHTSLAYIDPSVTTYAVQAIAGIVITLGAVVGIVWRKASKKAKQVLNIQDNSVKEVEEDVKEIVSDENA